MTPEQSLTGIEVQFFFRPEETYINERLDHAIEVLGSGNPKNVFLHEFINDRGTKVVTLRALVPTSLAGGHHNFESKFIAPYPKGSGAGWMGKFIGDIYNFE